MVIWFAFLMEQASIQGALLAEGPEAKWVWSRSRVELPVISAVAQFRGHNAVGEAVVWRKADAGAVRPTLTPRVAELSPEADLAAT
jgi:hypothetical protein